MCMLATYGVMSDNNFPLGGCAVKRAGKPRQLLPIILLR